MTEQQLDILREIKPYYIGYKRSSTLNIPNDLYAKLQDVHQAQYGNKINPCGSCLVRGIENLLRESGVGTE